MIFLSVNAQKTEKIIFDQIKTRTNDDQINSHWGKIVILRNEINNLVSDHDKFKIKIFCRTPSQQAMLLHSTVHLWTK